MITLKKTKKKAKIKQKKFLAFSALKSNHFLPNNTK